MDCNIPIVYGKIVPYLILGFGYHACKMSKNVIFDDVMNDIDN